MRLYLVSVGGQHGAQGERDLIHSESRGPAAVASIVQDVQADVAIAVDVGVHWAWRNEEHLPAAVTPSGIQLPDLAIHRLHNEMLADRLSGLNLVQGWAALADLTRMHL